MNEHLRRARDVLDERGVIAAMNEIIAGVYARNAARHDPALGDDAATFGITTSRNIANLAVRRLTGLPGVRARQVDTALEILCDGYVLRQYKLPGTGTGASVDSISWEDSEAKLDGAIANSAAGQLTLDADLDAGREAFGTVVPPMRHLRLVHAGDQETGECVIYLGIPRDNRDGGFPWYDVAVVHGEPGEAAAGEPGRDGAPGALGVLGAPGAAGGPLAGPAYDQLPLPDVGLAPRPAGRPVITETLGHGGTGKSP